MPVVVLAACGGSLSNAGGPGDPVPSVAGRTFLSTGVTGHTLVGDSPITIAFSSDGHVNANAGCNTMSGPYKIEGAKLVASNLAQTQMGCDPPARMDQDTWLAGFLTRDPALTLDGDTLRLTGGGVTVTLLDRKVAEPDKPLVGTNWVADTIIDRDAVSSESGPAVTMLFTRSSVSGNDGCNAYNANVAVAGDQLTFSDPSQTKMACAPPSASATARLHELLGGTGPVMYAIDADRLTLTAADGTGLGLRAAAK